MALTADRNTHLRPGNEYSYPMAAAVKAYAGGLAVLDAAGNCKPGVTAAGLIAAGRFEETVDNSAGLAAAKSVRVASGIFKWKNSAGGDAITKAHIGDTCYIVDDETVMITAAGKSPAGIVVAVDSDGVWVKTDPGNLLASTGLLAANNLSDVGTAATARDNLGFDVHEKQITHLNKFATVAGNLETVGADDGDETIVAAADNDVVQLPDAAAGNKGLRVTVINGAADAGALVSVSPHASDKIVGGIHGAAGGDLVSFAEGAGKDILNTKATSKHGDYAVLQSDGVDTWYVIGGKGVWASQA